MSPAYRRLLKISRIVHVYMTLFGLVLILFFSVTGFMLNHESWFLPRLKDRTLPVRTGTLPSKLFQPLDKLAIVEALRRDYGVSGFLGGDPKEFDTEDDDNPAAVPMARDMDVLFPVPKKPEAADDPEEPIVLLFTRAGGKYDVKIWQKDGKVEVTPFSNSWAGIMLDLHKGKATGRAWAWVIDITCVLLLIISLTGLVLWSSLKTRGKKGLVLLILGGVVSLLVYLLGVP